MTSVPTTEPSRRVFIYGSCVSRDTFEYLRPRGYELVDYVARQSLLSVYSRVQAAMPPVECSSRFQRRMLEGDWTSRLFRHLRNEASGTDHLLWDLCDERLGVRMLDDGGVVTRSVDSLASGLDATLAPSSRTVDFGESEHLRWWTRRLVNFRQGLDELGLLDRLVLVAPPWATVSASGVPVPSSYGRAPSEANRLFADYDAAAVETLGCPVVTLAEDEVRADEDHRWGLAPFHYDAGTYERLAAAIDSALIAARSDQPTRMPPSSA